MRTAARERWDASHPDPLAVRAGDVVTAGRRDDTWTEFVWCTGPDGRSGWIPDPALERGVDGVVRAGRDYDCAELTVAEGQVLDVIERLAGWSWCRDAAGRCGWVPDRVLAL
jgi:hypothetical protein